MARTKTNRKDYNKAEKLRRQLPSFTRGYRSYNFRDKDPIIDLVEKIFVDEGVKLSQVERDGGPKAATMKNWFAGKTHKPQFASVNAALRTIGYELVPSKITHGANVVQLRHK